MTQGNLFARQTLLFPKEECSLPADSWVCVNSATPLSAVFFKPADPTAYYADSWLRKTRSRVIKWHAHEPERFNRISKLFLERTTSWWARIHA